MNTTGTQNLKEFDNTAGWLSFFFVMNQSSRVTLKPPSPSPADPKIKKTNAVIW
jgi:hypothetical protein